MAAGNDDPPPGTPHKQGDGKHEGELRQESSAPLNQQAVLPMPPPQPDHPFLSLSALCIRDGHLAALVDVIEHHERTTASYALFLPRCAYLHSFVPEILQAVMPLPDHAVEALLERVWFSTAPPPSTGSAESATTQSEKTPKDEIPLKWQWPIGVLFDQLLPSPPPREIPWRIRLHLAPSPSALPPTLLPFSSHHAKTHFLNALKEADWSRFGNVSRSMALSKQSTLDLWSWLHTPSNWPTSKFVVPLQPLLPPCITQIQKELGLLDSYAQSHPPIGVACKVLHPTRVYQQKWRTTTTLQQVLQSIGLGPPSAWACWLQGIRIPLHVSLRELLPLSYLDTFLYLVVVEDVVVPESSTSATSPNPVEGRITPQPPEHSL